MTGPEDRRRGLDRAIAEFKQLLANRDDDDDVGDIDTLTIYEKE